MGNLFLQVSSDTLRGEINRSHEGQVAESGKDLLPLEGYLVGDNGILNGRRPKVDVVQPLAAAREVVFKTVHMALIDGAMDCRVNPIKDGD